MTKDNTAKDDNKAAASSIMNAKGDAKRAAGPTNSDTLIEDGTSRYVANSLQLNLLIASLFCATFVYALDSTIIGTAVPSITSDLNSLDDIAWYGSGYLMTTTALQPMFGKLYRFANIKWVFIVCVLVFEVGSILCAVASTSAIFIVGRAIAGAGGAGLFQGALAIITRTVKLEKRPFCISIVTSTFAICVCIGPVIGGAFTEDVTWRWCFWINVPIGAVAMALIFFLFHLPKGWQDTKFRSMTFYQKLLLVDPVGSLLIMAAVVCILLALQWGGQAKPWGSGTVVGLLVTFAVLMGLFFWIQQRQGDDATLPIWLLKERSLLGSAIFSFFMAMPTYVYGYYIPMYFQAVKESTAAWSGVQYLAVAIPQMFAVVLTGALVTMTGYYMPFMVIGTAIALVGSGLFLMFDTNTSTAMWAGLLVLCGTGTGFSINLPYTVVQAVMKEDSAPTGNAMFQFMFQLGAAFSLSIGQTIFLGRLKTSSHQLTPSIPDEALVAAGAYDLRRLAGSEELYGRLRQVYMDALHNTYIFPVVAGGLALALTFILENKNIKTVSKERERTEIEEKVEA